MLVRPFFPPSKEGADGGAVRCFHRAAGRLGHTGGDSRGHDLDTAARRIFPMKVMDFSWIFPNEI